MLTVQLSLPSVLRITADIAGALTVARQQWIARTFRTKREAYAFGVEEEARICAGRPTYAELELARLRGAAS